MESSRLSRKLPDLKNSIGLAVCAHNLRQIGIAFHLYLLDHETQFPPLSPTAKNKATVQGKEVPVTEFYQDLLKPYLGLPAGEPINGCNGDSCREIPADSVFQCPATAPCKMGTLCHYGYHDMWPGSFASGTVKFSTIKPEFQLLVADVCYFGSPDGSGISRLYSIDCLCPRHNGYVNVLYADGHVNAEDINWLWESRGDGIPWNSHKPYSRARQIGPWPYQLPSAERLIAA